MNDGKSTMYALIRSVLPEPSAPTPADDFIARRSLVPCPPDWSAELVNVLRNADHFRDAPVLIIDPGARNGMRPIDPARNETPTSVPVVDLLRRGACTPACLLAYGSEANGCSCRCRGRHHGVLSAAEVPTCPRCHEQPPAGFRCLSCGSEVPA
ncbi:hypothetical protein [Plantactinospora sp. CA-290183]|uniref:hypothetical protein n=1 Tax=Plantactinospora sp. CA-290183 TaxID=3240006 RepID=UPI003D91FDB1